MMIRHAVRILGVAALLLLAVALVAQARPRTLREFVTAYPKAKGTRLEACVTCHASPIPVPNALNPYGAALKKAMFNFAAIEKQDSDVDGFANRKEIDLKSFPGDANDRPGARRDSAGADGKRDSTATGRDSTAALPDTLKQR